MMDPAARRLVVASALRLHVARRIGTGPIGTDASDLDDAADRIRPVDDRLERVHGLTFEPAYPGADAAAPLRDGPPRRVLTSMAHYRGEPAAVVVTTLIPGRPPQVTAAPPQTRAR